jgi:hypothetical protein
MKILVRNKTHLFTVLLCLLLQNSILAQTKSVSVKQLSRPEKWWVLVHPFAAMKAKSCTEEARRATDSLEKAGVLKDGNGGQLDAFRHAYWMSLLVQEMRWTKAFKLGEAHEKGNYLDWKKGKQEDGSRADSIAGVMDLLNNSMGIEFGLNWKRDTIASNNSRDSLIELIVAKVKEGKMYMVKKDAEGNPLTCEGQLIDPTMYDQKWYLPKCLVRSNGMGK